MKLLLELVWAIDYIHQQMPVKCAIKRKAIVRRYFLKNKKSIYERKRRWRLKNPVKMKASKTNARARRRGATGWIDVSVLELLLIKANKTCSYCGEVKDNIGFDHRVPLSRGGKHCINNLSVCCTRCNQRKYNRTIPEFKEYCASKGIPLII